MPVPDEELVARAQTGDTSAFDELVLRHQERVFRLAFHMLGNADDAADVQQEALLLAWSRLRGFRGQASFSTWLHRITVNCCIGRRRNRRPTQPLDEMADDRPCQDSLIDSITVRELLADIPDRPRAILLLREVDGMSVDEIAQVMGSSYAAVVQQLWRVRKLFRAKLRQHLTEDVHET